MHHKKKTKERKGKKERRAVGMRRSERKERKRGKEGSIASACRGASQEKRPLEGGERGKKEGAVTDTRRDMDEKRGTGNDSVRVAPPEKSFSSWLPGERKWQGVKKKKKKDVRDIIGKGEKEPHRTFAKHRGKEKGGGAVIN